MKNKIDAILNFIEQNDNFLLTAHINADGDAIACILGASLFLDRLNKNYSLVLHDQFIDSKYDYIKNWDKIQSFSEKLMEDNNIKAALIFDAPGHKRIGEVSQLINNGTPGLKIDHHPSEDNFSEIDWVDTESSSASAMLYEMIKQSNVKLDKEIAEAIYTGIIFDTGRLSYSNTRPRDYEICCHLVSSGVNPGEITNRMFFNNKAKSLQVVGQGLKSIKQYLDGNVTVITLLNNDLDGVQQYEIEDLANYSVSLRDSEVGIFIREIEPGKFKISLRSKSLVDVSVIASQFDGGGHVRASGCSYDGTYQSLLDELLAAIQKQL